jgi:hypothetical protein
MAMDFSWQQSRRSFPAYIAWVSTCLLAAGMGPLISPDVRTSWMQLGAFGLAAAVGLEISSRLRQFGHDQQSNRAIRRRYERELGQLTASRITSEAIDSAVGHILFSANGEEMRLPPRRVANRFRCKLPAMITELLDDEGHPERQSPQPFPGELQDISRTGFGLTHDRPINMPYVFLSVTLPSEEPMQFLGEMVWCKRISNGQFKSGGRFVRVLNPVDTAVDTNSVDAHGHAKELVEVAASSASV